METLDNILNDRIETIFQDKLKQLLDLSQWTAENRDEKLSGVRNIANSITDEGLSLVKEVIEKTIEDKTLLEYQIKMQLISGEIEILRSLRNQLDTANDEELKTFPAGLS